MDKKEAKKVQRQINLLLKSLSTPAALTPFIRKFCSSISDQQPIFLNCEPELWSRQSCCDRNVREYICIQGHGVPQYGYRIWCNRASTYVEAESHVVWRDGETLRDVSFSTDGEAQTLFLPVYLGFSGVYDDLKLKTREALFEPDKRALAIYEQFESTHRLVRWDDQLSWDIMTTWEEWLAGKRMPNQIEGSDLGFGNTVER